MSDAWNATGYVRSSRYRVDAVRYLDEHGPSLPSEIAESCGHSLPHTSRALAELKERSVVELLVPEERRRGRLYGLTERGRTVVEYLRGESELEFEVVEPESFSHGSLLSFLDSMVGTALRAAAVRRWREVELTLLDGDRSVTATDGGETSVPHRIRLAYESSDCDGVSDRRFAVCGFDDETVVRAAVAEGREVGVVFNADYAFDLPSFAQQCADVVEEPAT